MSVSLTSLTPLLSVWDMPEALAFYRDRLGFAIVSHSPEVAAAEGRYFHWCWLKRGEAQLMLNTAYEENARPASRDTARWAAHDDACLYVACSDVDAVHAELTSKGLDLSPPKLASYGMKQLYVRDPDGWLLCFQAPA